MEEQKEIFIYSEEVQDVLSHPPKSIFVWGNTILFGFFIVMLILSWLIKYPDILSSEIIITTEIPPEKIIAKTSGRIERILIEDKAKVDKNTTLAIIENPAQYEDVFFLKKMTDSIRPATTAFDFPIYEMPILHLGPIEAAYAVFERDYLNYLQNKEFQPHQITISAQNRESLQLQQELNLLSNQKEINQQELEFTKTDLDRHKGLFEKGVISSQEWERKNLEYLQQEKAVNSITAQIVQLHSRINDLQRNKQTSTVNQSKDEINLFRTAVLSYNQLKKAILEWELTYVLGSSISGQISFLNLWVENQSVQAGEDTFVIIPEQKSDYIGKIKAAQHNSGKIKVGQEVNIRLANYPDREFGMLRGIVKSISLTPDKEQNILIDIALPNALTTSYKKEINFHQEMAGTADIITEDLRLIERFLYQFRDIFKRKPYKNTEK